MGKVSYGAEEEERQRIEAARVEDLDRRIDAWHNARLIREFADAVETNAPPHALQPDSELGLWLQ